MKKIISNLPEWNQIRDPKNGNQVRQKQHPGESKAPREVMNFAKKKQQIQIKNKPADKGPEIGMNS